MNRVYARRYCLTGEEITATLAVIILVLALLPGFDLERYTIEDDQGRYPGIKDIMPAIPLIVAPWYIMYRGSYPRVPTMKRWLRHYLIPVLLGMIGVASGYIMCGSSALAFLFLMISFFGSEGTAMYRFASEPCPWHHP